MAQPISTATTTLSYPLWAVDFDPQDASRLIVGGGGGLDRSGISNKISLIDTSSPSTIRVSSEFELGHDEDNVTTLAAGPVKGRSTMVYAGANTNPADRQKGANEHLRVFAIDQASKSKAGAGPKIAELSRSALLAGRNESVYQRRLRITTPFPGVSQLGAVCSANSESPQIALFEVSATGSVTPRPRGTLDLSKDAQDLDVVQTSNEQYQLAYCSDYELFLYEVVGKGAAQAPVSVYEVDKGESPRPKFWYIRYLTPHFILALLRVPGQDRDILHGFRLPRAGQAKARIAVSAKLPKAVHPPTSLAVRNLSPPSSPSAKQGEAQFVVAVAGNGSGTSVSLYTLEYQVEGSADAMANLFLFKTLSNVHPSSVAGITSMAFSYFTTPKTTSREQSVKLASVSMSNTVVTHTIALKKVIDRPSSAKRAGPPRQPRYVVGLKSQRPVMTDLLVVIGMGIALLAILLQAVLEINGLVPSRLGASNAVPVSWRTPYVPMGPGPVQPQGGFLVQLLEKHKASLTDGEDGKPGRRIMLREDDLTRVEGEASRIQVVLHSGEEDEGAKEWEDLSSKQQARWKRKLKSAGHWAEAHGEGIFKDILFAELAGAVGAAVAG